MPDTRSATKARPSAANATADFIPEPVELQERAQLESQLSRTTTRPSTAGGVVEVVGQTASRVRAQKIVAYAMIALAGMNDSANGANLASMQATYKVSYDTISLVFLANVAGYFASCMSSSFLNLHYGLRPSLLIAGANFAIGSLIVSFAPPFPLFIIALVMLGYGYGLYDTSVTTVVSHEEDPVAMSTMMAMFGVGAMLSPIIVGVFTDKDIPWNYFYYIPLGLTLVLGLIAHFVFSTYVAPADEAHDAHPDSPDATVVPGRARLNVTSRMKRALRMRSVWVGFLIIVVVFAMYDIISGWLVTYLIEKRHANDGSSRFALSGLWAGIAVGRILFSLLLEKRLGEKTYAILLLSLASGFLAVIWAVNVIPVDFLSFALVGVFVGPIVPKVLSAVGARVPPSLKGPVMSLTIGLGLIGSGAGPLLFGVVAEKGQIASLPGVLIGMSVVASGGWLLMPRNERKRQD